MARDLSPEELSDYIHNRPQGRMLDLSHLLSNRATLRGAGWALVQSSAKLDSMSLATDLAIKTLEMPDAPEDVKELARRILRGEGRGIDENSQVPQGITCLAEVCPGCGAKTGMGMFGPMLCLRCQITGRDKSALPQASEETDANQTP